MEVEVKQQWMNVLDPVRLKPNLELISLYITLYKMLEDAIIQKPRDYFMDAVEIIKMIDSVVV